MKTAAYVPSTAALGGFITTEEDVNHVVFSVSSGSIPGVRIIEPRVFEDDRGDLMITYQRDLFQEAGIEADFIQDKVSRSKNGVLRGLHYQTGDHAQQKLVRCSQGEVFDVVVDLRTSSPSFERVSSHILSEQNDSMLYLPEGVAHGFLVRSNLAQVEYKIAGEYAPDYETGIWWDDPSLDIAWPVDDPILSERDQRLPTLEEARETGLLFTSM